MVAHDGSATRWISPARWLTASSSWMPVRSLKKIPLMSSSTIPKKSAQNSSYRHPAGKYDAHISSSILASVFTHLIISSTSSYSLEIQSSPQVQKFSVCFLYANTALMISVPFEILLNNSGEMLSSSFIVQDAA